MIDTLEMFKTGKNSRKSKHSIIQNDLDSIRSTLFGKFYEGIIAKWLQEHDKYILIDGKPCVYWVNTKSLYNASDKAFQQRINSALKKKKQKNVRTNSDGFFTKASNNYLWEAKNWAKWSEGKTVYNQVLDLLSSSPWLLAKEVKHNGEFKAVNGILFSWWQKFDRYHDIEKQISSNIRIPFKFYFTSKIIDDCRIEKYDWYLKLINEQKENIDDFFKELLGEK